jgi:aspartyl-tRNA(Asn)/glutamyl-tRNA(Gln) amidotransferase subunit A
MSLDFRCSQLSDLAADVRSARVAARELVAHALARIEAVNQVVGAFVAVDGDRALAAAARIDEYVAAGLNPGPLAGIPIAVKDLEDAAGFVTSRGSELFASGSPAEEDSLLVARLKAAGAVVVGKTNTSELGWTPDTSNRVFGPTRNPWNLDHSPGGSSGGTAAAIAAGMVPLGTGSDGGGSIRIPSSCCGLTGLKPSLGRVPSGGSTPPEWPILSTRGPMARRIADIVYALEVAIGPDPSDLASLPRPDVVWSSALEDPQVPLQIAWSPTLGYAAVDREVLAVCERAIDKLAELGADVVEVDSVFDEDPLRDWLAIATAYNLRTLEPYRSTPQWGLVDQGLVRQVEHAAANMSVVELLRAHDACHSMNLRLVDLFRRVRLLVTPTCAGAPPPRSLDGAGLIDGQVRVDWVRFTYPFNMTRSPAASVCVGLTNDGLPVGLQLVGPQHADLVVIRAAAALEEVVAFDAVAPLS